MVGARRCLVRWPILDWMEDLHRSEHVRADGNDDLVLTQWIALHWRRRLLIGTPIANNAGLRSCLM
jgi:hypothetical protein